jgi:hypothetical protein
MQKDFDVMKEATTNGFEEMKKNFESCIVAIHQLIQANAQAYSKVGAGIMKDLDRFKAKYALNKVRTKFIFLQLQTYKFL